MSDPQDGKSPEQRRAEAELHALAERAVDGDFPFFGACYGIGILGSLRTAGWSTAPTPSRSAPSRFR